ncbi:PLP-dependent transferase [Ramlibacter sp.]|uniref:trans-sulfuration enzyme family protein n=1 Tax=Ramlibacter sp. TaxID=1917967 RepID=UPI001794DD46|nr:PLP-dependent transferase [Ramlibacter sp.]MBA2673799.1 PLP-dependent transferase [Ramlibacter sp.]
MQSSHPAGAPPSFDAINVPVHRASTILFPSTDAFLNRRERLFDGYSYGLYGTPTTRALESEIAKIEGGVRSVVVPSGLAAITHGLMAVCKSGDHVLAADCIYGSSRTFLLQVMRTFGVTVEFFPADAGSIAALLRPGTAAVLLESPGYYTMEIQDIAPIAEEAHRAGARVLIDNTWGFGASRMFEHGVDMCCTALSKYASGHADLCMGSITVADEGLFRRIKAFVASVGSGVSSDDAYMVLRGLSTLDTRLAEHARRGLVLSDWLQQQGCVDRVLNPALPGDPHHARFARYFDAGNGLVSVLFRKPTREALTPMLDGFRRFRIGASWGSSHSLVSLAEPAAARSCSHWAAGDYVVRFHMGLEPMDQLLADLHDGVQRLESAR